MYMKLQIANIQLHNLPLWRSDENSLPQVTTYVGLINTEGHGLLQMPQVFMVTKTMVKNKVKRKISKEIYVQYTVYVFSRGQVRERKNTFMYERTSFPLTISMRYI